MERSKSFTNSGSTESGKLDSLNNQIENLQSKNTELEVLLKNYLTQIF
jgi:hypothetical protein